MKTVFLVEACNAWEATNSSAAFESESEAEKFIEECRQYDETFIELDDDDDDETFNKWFAENEEWKKKHPLGEYAAQSDTYMCSALEVYADGERPPTGDTND